MKNSLFIDGTPDALDTISKCHESAFPDSLSTKFGRKYLIKMYGWYLAADNRFLFYTGTRENCTGFCGGIFNSGSAESGSSSSMVQFTLRTAIICVLKNPFILFHGDILSKLPFILKNLVNKTKKIVLPNKIISHKVKYAKPYVGLVVIGVSSEFQGKGIGSKLLQEFEQRALKSGYGTLQLSVKKNNLTALKSYKRNGWLIKNDLKDLYILKKSIKITES